MRESTIEIERTGFKSNVKIEFAEPVFACEHAQHRFADLIYLSVERASSVAMNIVKSQTSCLAGFAQSFLITDI